MMWYLIMGALLFAAGMIFEKLLNAEVLTEDRQPQEEKIDPKLYYQWENLLGYDGTKQEEVDYENR